MTSLLAPFRSVVSWRQILRRTFDEAFFKDNCLGMAAQLSYYFLFALFPTLLVLVAIASYFPLSTLVDEMVRILGGFAPPEVLAIIAGQLAKISQGDQGGLLTLGMLTALWSSSAAMTAIIDTLNRAYDVEEGRAWWKVRLLAVALTIGGALFILVSLALILVGPAAAEWLASWGYFGDGIAWTWKILQWPFVFVLASLGMAFIYYFAPDAEQDWVWLTPGSVAATTLWLGATLGFKYYVTNMAEYAETYGALAGVMVMMLWFYISGLVILLGAEINAEIEHAAPQGKNPGEKVPGERRLLGARTMREWINRRRRKGEKPPSAADVKVVVESQLTEPDGTNGVVAPLDENQRRPIPGGKDVLAKVDEVDRAP